MKTKILSLVAMFALGTFTVFAGEKTEKFKVKGNVEEAYKVRNDEKGILAI